MLSASSEKISSFVCDVSRRGPLPLLAEKCYISFSTSEQKTKYTLKPADKLVNCCSFPELFEYTSCVGMVQ